MPDSDLRRIAAETFRSLRNAASTHGFDIELLPESAAVRNSPTEWQPARADILDTAITGLEAMSDGVSVPGGARGQQR